MIRYYEDGTGRGQLNAAEVYHTLGGIRLLSLIAGVVMGMRLDCVGGIGASRHRAPCERAQREARGDEGEYGGTDRHSNHLSVGQDEEKLPAHTRPAMGALPSTGPVQNQPLKICESSRV
jgi:hypothetical protein